MNESTTPAGTVKDGVRITRIFDAPRELVFKAWTEPERFADWWGGPEVVVPLESVSMDVRPGGEWRATMQLSGGGEIPWHGAYQEVVEPERLVLTLSDRPTDEYELLTIVFNDLDGRTEMVFHQTGGHLTEEGYEQVREGYAIFFDAMAAQVEQG